MMMQTRMRQAGKMFVGPLFVGKLKVRVPSSSTDIYGHYKGDKQWNLIYTPLQETQVCIRQEQRLGANNQRHI